MGAIAAGIIAFISMFVPGVLLALALLYKRTDFHIIEIAIIGFVFGLIAPASLTWIESFLIGYSHAFAFSLGLFELNALILTIVGVVLCYQQGVFKGFSLSGITRPQYIKQEEAQMGALESDYSKRIEELRKKLSGFAAARSLIELHKGEEDDLRRKHRSEQGLIGGLSSDEKAKMFELHKAEERKLIEEHEKEERIMLNRLSGPVEGQVGPKPFINFKTAWPWMLLIAIILITFATRAFGIGVSPHFYEFDPYFDMMATQSILVYGQQFYTAHSAWPIETAGSVMRVQPLVPYIEAYWYSLANYLGPKNSSTFNTNLMSYVGSVYPPITAALLVFSIFVLLYHEYGKYVALIGAALTAGMPVLFTTFVAGEQLLEPWGIFTLFFFFAMYVIAVRDMKNSRLAILAGIAFASTFLGAHYYTVDAGVLAAYILLQGIIGVLQGTNSKYFYKMNIIVIFVIGIFLAAYTAYKSTLSGKIPGVLGIPVTLALPILALVLVAVIEYGPKVLKRYHVLFRSLNWKEYAGWIVIIALLAVIVGFASPLRTTLIGYITLSAHYTTPSIALFMTVQEYIPTGVLYNFAAEGFGVIGAGISYQSSGTTVTVPILVLLISGIATILIAISIIFRKSTSGIFYLAIAGPLMFAGFSEVKYLPHFGVAFIMLFCIMIGELLLIADNDLSIRKYSKNLTGLLEKRPEYLNAFKNHQGVVYSLLALGVFFISPILAMVMLILLIFLRKQKDGNTYLYAVLFFFIIFFVGNVFANHSLLLGESSSITSAFTAAFTYATNPANACTIISDHGNSIGADMFCNQIPAYWLDAMAWIRDNVGVSGPRVLAWWDYGDWINWFGNAPAVLRGDNSEPAEDYATAAQYVLSQSNKIGPSTLANMMNTNQTEYVLFDQDLLAKWQAVDFLACVDVNETSRAYAIAAGQAETPPQTYALGTSQCEIEHDPEFVLVPLAALVPSNSSIQQSISYYCSASNSTVPLIESYVVQGDSLANFTACVSSVPNSKGVLAIYNQSGGKTNAVIQSSFYEGVITISGIEFVEYVMIYLPNGPNDTITNAPTLFYNSSYYRGFFLGELPGFHEVYPNNSTDEINYVNGTYAIRIYALDNYTGQLPPRTTKPTWVSNNFTMPG